MHKVEAKNAPENTEKRWSNIKITYLLKAGEHLDPMRTLEYLIV